MSSWLSSVVIFTCFLTPQMTHLMVANELLTVFRRDCDVILDASHAPFDGRESAPGTLPSSFDVILDAENDHVDARE